MVVQILRFVSPHPWGSPGAEGFRKIASLDRIAACIFDHALDTTSKERSAFSAGSHVLWTPVYVEPGGQIKHAKPGSGSDGWAKCWLASRSPPYRSANGLPGLEIDITSLILDKKSSTDPVEVLYDNRFVLSFDLHAIPDEVLERLRTSPVGHRLVVTAAGKYFLPRLAFRVSKETTTEDIGIPGPDPGVGSVVMVSGIDGRLSRADWAKWRLARVFE